MRHYETIYIINPDLSEKDYQAVVAKFGNLVEKLKGVVIKTQEWGKQRLAYFVKKIDRGFYVLVEYCADANVTAEFERALKLDDSIVKFQTVKLADKADPEALLLKEREAARALAGEGEEESGQETETGDEEPVKKSEEENGISE